MAHLIPVRLNAQWPNETVLTATDLQRYDVNQSKTIDGVNGGSYAPTSPIILGGAGLKSIVSGVSISGGITTQTGGRLQLGANDFPQLSPTRPLTRVCPLWMLPMQGGPIFSGAASQSLGDVNLVLSPPPLLGVQVAPGVMATSASAAVIPIPSRYLVHRNSSSLASYTLTYRVLYRPASVPSSPLSIYLAGVADFVNNSDPGAPVNDSSGSYSGPSAIGVWQLNHAFALGSYVTPTSAHLNGYYYKATSVSGTGTSSNVSEPTWPTTIGATVTDNPGSNQIVWTNMGYSGAVSPNQSVDSYYASGAQQSVTFTLDPAFTATLDNTNLYYVLRVHGLDPSILLHTLSLTFTGLAQMGFL